MNRDQIIKQHIQDMLIHQADLLERLGSDYDENGVPYWEGFDTPSEK